MPSTDDTALPGEVRERIAQYEKRAVRVESTLADYRRRLPLYRRCFAGLVLAGLACFGIGWLSGLWGTISSIVIRGGGYAMLLTRLWELQADVTSTRDEIAILRHRNRA